MKNIELSPAIQQAAPDSVELAILRDAVEDLVPKVWEMSEAELLDETAARGATISEKTPALSSLMRTMATHRGPTVTILDLPPDTLGDIGPTPVRHPGPGEHNLFSADLYRGLLLGMADWYGYGYTTQQEGVIHNNLIAVKKFSNTPGHSASANYPLGLHTEEASFNLPDVNVSPDFLTLHFFRNPTNIPTIVSTPDISELSTSARDLLSGTWYQNNTSPAQGGEGNNSSQPVSILYGPPDDPWVRINTASMDLDKYTPTQIAALNEFMRHVEARSVSLALDAGQIALIDNRRALHGRPPYSQQPCFDGTDRWQRRVVVSDDKQRIQAFETAPRVVDPEQALASGSLVPAALATP
ncbi:MAG TPA: TauD/TfdA family dioxygenase [Candidatus Limnocylindria bacterium]|nr:TauD/TfdA family dioxygenase [Candidatus Limnocylindria bacterium]